MNKTRRIVTLIIMTAFVISTFSISASAASKKYALPTSAKVYRYDDGTGKWDHYRTVKIKYNKKGDPIRYGESKISYKYRGNKRKKVTINTPAPDYGGKIILYYNKKGRLYKTSEDGTISTNKKGWVTKERYGEGKMSFKYYGNGSPKKISSNDGYMKFNKKGLPTSSKMEYQEDTIYSSFSYKYDKKGRIKQLVYRTYGDKFKVKYSYSKKIKTKHQRKWAVIITNALGGAGSIAPALYPYYMASLPYAVQNDLW